MQKRIIIGLVLVFLLPVISGFWGQQTFAQVHMSGDYADKILQNDSDQPITIGTTHDGKPLTLKPGEAMEFDKKGAPKRRFFSKSTDMTRTLHLTVRPKTKDENK